MARPLKPGLDYYPFNVDLLIDEKFLEAKMDYGYLAPMIYKDKGYYLAYDEKSKNKVLTQIAMIYLPGKYQPDKETIGRVIDELATEGLFDRESLRSGILTSRRIQQNYYKAVSDRKLVDIEWKYWLLSEEDMRELGSSNPILEKYINRPINEVNHPINPINHPINSESRQEKTIKEETIKDINTSGKPAVVSATAHHFDYQLYADYWNRNVSQPTSIASVRNSKYWTDTRKRNLRARVKAEGEQTVLNIFDTVRQSDFLSGRATDWQANFDWVIKAGNFQKIADGNYKNRSINTGQKKESYYDKVIRGEA